MKEEWFREGARAFRAAQFLLGNEHLLPPGEDLYACPLCLKYIFRIGAVEAGELTWEDAPPKALGGRPLALTCQICNNSSGTHFDAEAEKQERLRTFFSGQSASPMRVEYTADGVTNRGHMHLSSDGGILLIGVPKNNKPADVALFEQALTEAGTGLSIKISPRLKYSPDHARVSWIRAAYVAAFAAFGWRYILQTSLSVIRAQFQNPTIISLPHISLYEPEANSSRREIFLAREPAECQSVVVRIGRHSVFLPAIDSTRTLADLAESLHGLRGTGQGAARYSMSGTFIPWPTKPGYLLDPETMGGKPRIEDPGAC